MFSLYVSEGPAGYAAEQHLELVGGPGVIVVWIRPALRKSQELNDLLARAFRAKGVAVRLRRAVQ